MKLGKRMGNRTRNDKKKEFLGGHKIGGADPEIQVGPW